MDRPRRVSVVVPTRDRPELLRQALASIRALEGPDLVFEILVGDNGTAAQTPEVAAALGAVYLKVERDGAGAARNAALTAATSDYCAFLDDDDVWLPGSVRGHLALLESRPELEAVVGRVVMTDTDLQPIGVAWPTSPGEGDRLLRAMLTGYYPQIGALVVRTRVREDVGLFDEALLGDQDWDWQLRIARRRRMGFVPVSSVLFRQRSPGSYDVLRLKRVGYTRRVFFRHAIPEWRLWNSPQAFFRAYAQAIWQFYEYFVEAALQRTEAGERGAAWRAIIGAFRIFPLRATYHLLAPTPFRKAFLAVIALQLGRTRYSKLPMRD